jgi:hypothetical protein
MTLKNNAMQRESKVQSTNNKLEWISLFCYTDTIENY